MSEDQVTEKNYTEKVQDVPGDTSGVISESDLLSTIKKRESSVSAFYKELKEKADANKDFYIGNQIDKKNVYVGEEPIVINKVLPAVETVIPMVTDKTPEPDVTVIPNNRKNAILQEKLEKKLHDLWSRDLGMQMLLEKGVRQLATSNYMVTKVVWEEDSDEVKVLLLPAGRVAFSKDATCKDNLGFLIEYVPYTVRELKAKFPDKAEALQLSLNQTEDSGDDSVVTIVEYWEDEFVCWKYKDVILGFEANPYFNWDDENFNHIKKPTIPYFITNIYSFGDSVVDPVGMVDLMKMPQKSVNKRKKQIEQNADMGNGRMVFAGNRINKAGADAITNAPGEKIYLDGADTTEGAVSVLTGRSFDQGIYTDMQDTKAEIDNIVGVHGTTRGERGSDETAAGRQILKTGDTSRQRTIVRAFEGLSKDLFNFFIQCMYVYYDGAHPLHPDAEFRKKHVLSSRDQLEYISREEFRGVKIEVDVIDGSIVPRDKDAQKAEALELAKNKMMSLLDMYRILEYPDPEKMARNAIMEQVDPMFLYSEVQKGDQLDFQAIRNLLAIQYNDTGEVLPLTFDSPDLKLMGRYLETLTSYLKGEEIHQELIPFSSLTMDAQQEVIDHYNMQRAKTEALIDEQTAENGGVPVSPPQPDAGQSPEQSAPPQVPSEAAPQGPPQM